MKKYLQKLVCIPILFCVLLAGCARQPIVQKSVDTAMGTVMTQVLYVSAASGATGAKVHSEQILEHIENLETQYLSWRLESSEVYRINQGGAEGQLIPISKKMYDYLEQCKRIYAASEGAFDFTVGSVARLWNIDAWTLDKQAEVVLPEAEAIASALQKVGAEHIQTEGMQIELPEGMQIDLGAVGKGIVLDEIKEYLARQEDVTGAVVSAGGSILTYGSKPGNGFWNVAIVNPFDTAKSLGILKLKGQWCVSTSGDYERFVEVDGVRYHHILNPATGYPANSGVKSVTILSENGLLSDALSTACFVLGVEEGRELAESFQVEALFVNEQGEIIMTDGMKQYFHAG